MGVISPLGVGSDATWQAIQNGHSGVRTVPEWVEANWPIPICGDVVDFEPKQYVKPRKSLKVMSRETQLGFSAAMLAWEESGLADSDLDRERFGVINGANMFCPEVPELAAACHACDIDGKFDFEQWGGVGMREIIPLWLLKYLPNMTPCHIGISLDARGPTNSVVAGDVSALTALIEAADVISRGHADVMIAGGNSSMIAWMDLLWHAGANLSRRIAEPTRACRPFDADRDGFVGGEGAAMFVLERADMARARGAQAIAALRGYARRYESAAHTLRPTGQAVRQAIDASIAAADLSPQDMGHVNAHGDSTVHNDRIEAQAISDRLGETPVTAAKSLFGNLGAGSGAVELAVSLLGIQHGVIPPTLNYDQPDPECPVRVVTNLQPAPNNIVLALNHRSAGQAVALVVEAAGEPA